jgi:hypothetical protein
MKKVHINMCPILDGYRGPKILKLGNERVNQNLCTRIILKSMFRR